MSYSKFQVSQEFIDNCYINAETYEKLYTESLENLERFWTKQANWMH